MATAPPPAAAAPTAPKADDAGRSVMPTPAGDVCKRHRRESSLWVPLSRPALTEPVQVIRHKTETSKQQIGDFFGRRCLLCCPRFQTAPEWRLVVPNHKFDASLPRYQHPNRSHYADNRIRTTKYSLLSFLPKNLFEQFHRIANLYFIMIVTLNWFPIFEAFSKYLGMIPISLILFLTAIKDAFEDWRRYKSDQKINHSTCRVWDNEKRRYRKMEWRNVLVGDMVHLSCNEIIPADILLLRSSDPLGICYVETSNLDGESNLKQRQVVAGMADHSSPDSSFKPTDFNGTVECERPNNHIYRFNGKLRYEDGLLEPLSRENLLLRGCQIRNTDFCEGIVIYAGKDTKAMLNNSGPRYKRSGLERTTNFDILWCVLILVVMCTTGAVFSMVWLNNFIKDGSSFSEVLFLTYVNLKDVSSQVEALENFGSFIISLQILIPLSLYISIEVVKLGQLYFMSQDMELYYEPTDKRIQCRALNIPEELGQIQYVMSDKTGTLTENKMIFRRCGVAGVDYGPTEDEESDAAETADTGRENKRAASQSTPLSESEQNVKVNEELVNRVAEVIDTIFEPVNGASCAPTMTPDNADIYHFFVNMALCNTVVVNAHPHYDRMNESGFFVDDTFVTGNSEFHVGSSDDAKTIESLSTQSVQYSQLLETPSSHSAPRFVPLTNRRQPLTPVGSQNYTGFDRHTSRSQRPEDASPTAPLDNDLVMETSFFVPQALTTDTFAEETEKSDDAGTDQSLESPSHLSPTTPLSSFRLARNFSKLNEKMKSISPLSLLKKGKQTPRSESPPAPANPIYEAESPDELSLVYAASAYGVPLVKRHVSHVTLGLPGGRMQRFQLLNTLPFDSHRKRMSVIVMPPGSSRPVLYCKGADTAIMDVLSERFRNTPHGDTVICKSQRFLNEYSGYGLRTLCLAKRELDNSEYKEWKVKHDEAEMDMENRSDLILESAMRIEKDLELIGVTGIEDRLQDGVAECIEALRLAGMNVWVLTGDKIETAVNIAYASKLFHTDMQLLELCTTLEEDTPEMLDIYIEQLEETKSETGERSEVGMVVSGQTLAYCFSPLNKGKFVRLVSRCVSVLCCRTTPLQKAAVVRLAKEQFKGKVLAIGDGANDVSMIQCADVGIGISGQEGMQAVMASDFALARFRFLQRLLLVHGHWCYDRLARTILYFLYKNAVFVFVIYWCQFYNGFSAQSPMDPIFMMIFPIIFTSVPPIVYGICEQDAPDSLLIKNPKLYAVGRKGKLYRRYSFWVNMADALWQSLMMYFIAHLTYTDSDCSMWSFGFLLCTDLLIINNLHLAIEVRLWNMPMLLSLTISVVAYFSMALAYNRAVDPGWGIKSPPAMVAESAITDVRFWAALILTTVLALLPRFIIHVFLNSFFPCDVVVERMKQRSQDGSVDADRIPFVQRISDWWQKRQKTADVEVVPNIVLQIDNQIVVSPTYQM